MPREAAAKSRVETPIHEEAQLHVSRYRAEAHKTRPTLARESAAGASFLRASSRQRTRCSRPALASPVLFRRGFARESAQTPSRDETACEVTQRARPSARAPSDYTKTARGEHPSLTPPFLRDHPATYSAGPRTPGRGGAGNSSSSGIANTFGSVSAIVGSGSKPSGTASSISTS